jgi:hypothetical protein
MEAAIVAEDQAKKIEGERRRALELEHEQVEYEVTIARRRYESVDPDNRLVASDLEARWNEALGRLRECEAQLTKVDNEPQDLPNREELLTLAGDLEAAWNATGTSMRTKQQIVRSLIREIAVDVDDRQREVVIVIHWRGGQHSEVKVNKPESGEHRYCTSREADELIREMATQWSDAHIAATLNRMKLKTGQGLNWNRSRIGAYRQKHRIHGYASRTKDGSCLTMDEAAKRAAVSRHAIRTLVQRGLLPARQIMRDAPWQILVSDLDSPAVQEALRARRSSPKRPCRDSVNQLELEISTT